MRYGIYLAVSVVVVGVASCGGSSDLGPFGDVDAATGSATGAGGGAPDGGAVPDGAGGDDAPAEGGSSADQACGELATVYCQRISTCAPILKSLLFGDEATCIARALSGCVKGLGAPSTGATAARYRTCAADVKAVDCTSLLTRNNPVSCRPSGGTVAEGGACGDDWQCQSGYCATPGNQACGTCATRKPAGGTCTDDEQCGYGLNCAGAAGSKVCVTQGMSGSTCDDNHPCASPNVCIGKTATAAGTCGAGAAPGGACEASGCDFAQALFCHPITHLCQKITFAEPGEQCGVLNNGLVGCTGSTCLPPGQAIGTCGAIADDGAACNDAAGPRCKVGAKCIAGSCRLPDPTACN